MLRLALELCTVKRRLIYRKAARQEAARTLTAILAGLGVATDLMLIKVMNPVDTVVHRYPELKVYVIADDVKLGMHDKDEERLARQMAEATHELVRLVEVEHCEYPEVQEEISWHWGPQG